ncbi:MAG: peptidylprolyl isomerase [Proteobacteria bacterium]|nr:peptidylprolyl isomerase [Pseudomonadota bacterium]
MATFPGSKSNGIKILATTSTIVAIFLSFSTLAQDPDPDVFELFLESRIQKPVNQATAQERKNVMSEMTDIYLVTNQARAIELSKNPRIKAEIEFQRRIIMFRAFAQDFLASNPASDQEIFNAYQEQIALSSPKEFKARHILVESQGEAVALVEQLQGGADFIELAKEKSTGPSGPAGGDLGWFTAQGMVKPFSDAVAKLEDGEFTTTPVQTSFGWHVILREDSRDGSPPPMESVRNVIKQKIENENLRKYISSLRSRSGE